MITTVRLGGVEYTLKALPIRKAREWRKRLEEYVGRLGALGAIDLGGNIAQTIEMVRSTVLTAPDVALELVYAYAPDIAADAERIENEATDEEVVAVLGEVLRQVYPFGAMLKLIGQRVVTTSKS